MKGVRRGGEPGLQEATVVRSFLEETAAGFSDTAYGAEGEVSLSFLFINVKEKASSLYAQESEKAHFNPERCY